MRAKTPIVLLTLLAAGAGNAPARAQLLPPGAADAASTAQSPDSQPGMEVLTRGPVHEAFAEVATAMPEPSEIIPREPPQPIEEQPPETRPDGENVVWLPGYWHWDEERSDFLWVSGVWRAVPPDREWTPGYWRDDEGGYQWVAGYWADRGAASAEVQYLPAPPETLEAGPSGPSPGDNYTWSPGCWVWQSRYVWRPGSWIVVQPNWIWIPNYYVWTPYGCVLAGGYMDYVVQRRGLLFAPVYFSSPIYTRPAFAYRPSYCIGYDVLTSFLFARQRSCHYYFGDYFGPRYAGVGYRPWFQSTWGRSNYDPLFAYYRNVNLRNNRQWDRQQIDRYAFLRDNPAARPPRTLAAQQALLAADGRGGRDGARGEVRIAQSLDRFRDSARDQYGVQLGQANRGQLELATERRQAWKTLQDSRKKTETAAGTGAAVVGGPARAPHNARWNVENPIARDVPNVQGPETPRIPRPSTGQGLAQPGRTGDGVSPGNGVAREIVRPDLGNRDGNRDRGQGGRDPGNFGRGPRDNALTNPGQTDRGSRQTLRPVQPPDADDSQSLPGVSRDRTPGAGSRGRPNLDGGQPSRRPESGVGPNRPSLTTPEQSPRTTPDRSFRRPGDQGNSFTPRDNALRGQSTPPSLSQPGSPQSGAGRNRGNWQRPSGIGGGGAGGGQPNLSRQSVQRPVTPPSFRAPSGGGGGGAPAIQRSAPTPRQLPGGGGGAPGGSAGGGAQFRRPTAAGGGGAAVAAPSGGSAGPQINRGSGNPNRGGAAARGRGKGGQGDP